QFIISELIPNLLEDNPFVYFLSRLKNIDSQSESVFKSLNEYLKQYNATIPGHGLQLLEKINALLYEIYPKKSKVDQKSIFVQVDTAFSSKNTLSHKVAEEAASAASLIWKIDNSSSRKKNSDNYYSQFIEKYGTEQLVPFFDLINENIGLGIPAHYLSNKETFNYIEKKDSFEWFLSKKYQEAVYLGQKEVALIDEEIQHYLKKKPQVTDIPTSLEIFCEILATDQASIDAGDFNLTLGLSQVSQPIGGTFGRFLHILPKEAKTSLLKAYTFEQKLAPEKLYVKFSWLPASSGVGNVMIGNNLRDFSLVFPSNDHDINTILYEDVYVGASQRGLYLFSKRLNQELILLTDNLVNQYFAPPVFKFLLDLSKENINPMQGIYWDQFDYFSYLPRVRYNKTYLSLARWYLRLKEISLKKNPSTEDLVVWLKKWNVCRFVMMADQEQYLLLDIQEENHLSIILNNLIKNDKVCLIEKKSIKKSAWAQSNKGAHFTEIIIPLLKNQSLANKIPIYPQTKKDENKFIEKRTRRLGSNWIYIKLFCSRNTQEDFLQRILPSFIEKITQKKICEKWFYIRYEENTINPHIRLRIKFSQNQFLQVILPIINKWSEQLIQEGFLKDISFHSYERELERYGGVGLIEYAETLFHADSIVCIALLQDHSKITSLPLYGIAALSIIDFLISLKLSKEDQIALLQEIFSSKEALEGYRFYKKQLLDLTSIKTSNESSSSLKQIFSMRHLACKSYAKKAKIEGIDFLSTKGKRILHSFIHMHCNRLLGIDPSIEEKSILFAAETIKKSLYVLEKEKNFHPC
ncbi:MAG: lantibiotic dehydratase, partial [Verrucomicrobiota bacterium]